VDAALIRTFIDRTVGWRASRIAKRYTESSTNSMGRVQTPTLGFVVDRELEREAHIPVRYFEVLANTSVTSWNVRFHEKTDADAWADEKGKFSAHRTANEPLARSAHVALTKAGCVKIVDVERRQKSQAPKPPFSTDTLLQAAGSRWGWSPKKTAALAGKLYEAGHITYIRTDSTRLAEDAVEAGRAIIAGTWGVEQLSESSAPKAAAGVQDAHEAIRPTDLALEVVPDVEPDVQKLFALVRARTLASLMVSSLRVTLSLSGICEGLGRTLDGTVGWYAEPGWRRAFEAAGLDEKSDTVPLDIPVGTIVELTLATVEQPNPVLREDQTKPPPRYRAHTLVKKMKDGGIGRPSTYAKTVDSLEERGYVTIEEGTVVPTVSGRNVWLEAAPLFSLQNGQEVFQTEYTAEMESLLDDVAHGRTDASTVWEKMLTDFKSAHAAALDSGNDGPLVPRTRRKLQDYLEAAPELETESGSLDSLTEAEGRALLEKWRTRGIKLLPTKKQQQYLEKLLADTRMTLERAVESTELILASEAPNRDECAAIIEQLLVFRTEHQPPSQKQLRWIGDLVKKLGLDEASACALVGAMSYEELTGGKSGTASKLIDLLREKLQDDKGEQ
jgi:DNA topoisomerase-1